MTAQFHAWMVCAAMREAPVARVHRALIAAQLGTVAGRAGSAAHQGKPTAVVEIQSHLIARIITVRRDKGGFPATSQLCSVSAAAAQRSGYVERPAVQRDRPATTAFVVVPPAKGFAMAPVAPPASATAVLSAVQRGRPLVEVFVAPAVKAVRRGSAVVQPVNCHAVIHAVVAVSPAWVINVARQVRAVDLPVVQLARTAVDRPVA